EPDALTQENPRMEQGFGWLPTNSPFSSFFLSRSIFFEKCATTCARIYTTYARIAAIRALVYKNADFCIKINT
ncbi:MAG: hypothetical protein U0L68_07355, partial [Prevotellamassilia sp.]|nr:hypothetical protein [Prevotellamassilia sp.]